MPAGNAADGKSHRQDGKTERKCNTYKTNAKFGKRCGKHGTAASAEYEPKRSKKFCNKTFLPISPLRSTRTFMRNRLHIDSGQVPTRGQRWAEKCKAC
ncbi:hypothetical protein J2W42_002474 [Rhizobium tibeticum]|nr:hypothetical protein [Rhizobium tibeticum]